MVSTCFISPASFSLRSRQLVQRAGAQSSVPNRTTPSLSIRLPGGNYNPFGSNSFGSSIGRFFSFGSGGSFGGNFGSGAGSGGRGRRGGGRSAGEPGGGATGKSGNFFTQLWTAYNSRLDRFPITTKAFTSLIGFLLGDIIAQKFVSDKANINWGRVARMASFGFLIHGPTGHYFYAFLDRSIVGTTPLKVAAKVAVDQLIWAPIFTALFFSYLGFAEGKSLDDVITKIRNDTWTGVKASWKFWPLAHAINFAFVPTSQRLLYINTLQVGYNVILSLIGNK